MREQTWHIQPPKAQLQALSQRPQAPEELPTGDKAQHPRIKHDFVHALCAEGVQAPLLEVLQRPHNPIINKPQLHAPQLQDRPHRKSHHHQYHQPEIASHTRSPRGNGTHQQHWPHCRNQQDEIRVETGEERGVE